MKMRHPEIAEDQVPADTTKEAFDQVWSDLGWVEVPEETPTDTLTPNPAITPAERKAALEAAKAAAAAAGGNG